MTEDKIYELIIIGVGPAGIAGAVYAARYRIDFLIIGGAAGGNMSASYDIDNYPGYVHTTGPELTKNMIRQLKAVGHEPIIETIKEIQKKEDIFER